MAITFCFFGVSYSESMFYRQGNELDTIAECLLAPCLSPPALSDGCTARRFDMSQQDTEGPAIKCKYRTLWMSSCAHWCTFIITVAPNIQISSDVSCTCSQSASLEQKAKHELHIEINSFCDPLKWFKWFIQWITAYINGPLTLQHGFLFIPAFRQLTEIAESVLAVLCVMHQTHFAFFKVPLIQLCIMQNSVCVPARGVIDSRQSVIFYTLHNSLVFSLYKVLQH